MHGDASNAQPDIFDRVALGDASRFGTASDALRQEEIRMVTSGTVRWQCDSLEAFPWRADKLPQSINGALIGQHRP